VQTNNDETGTELKVINLIRTENRHDFQIHICSTIKQPVHYNYNDEGLQNMGLKQILKCSSASRSTGETCPARTSALIIQKVASLAPAETKTTVAFSPQANYTN
jgi:hypothetical protein